MLSRISLLILAAAAGFVSAATVGATAGAVVAAGAGIVGAGAGALGAAAGVAAGATVDVAGALWHAATENRTPRKTAALSGRNQPLFLIDEPLVSHVGSASD